MAPQYHGDDTGSYVFSSWTVRDLFTCFLIFTQKHVSIFKNLIWYYIGTQSDNFNKTGCFNLICSGFVQTHPTKYIGARLDIVSIYDGLMMETEISITKVMFIPFNFLYVMLDMIYHIIEKG